MAETLHYKTQENQPYGSESRKCSRCGTRLWLATDGTWTDDLKVWTNPPEGFVNCFTEKLSGESSSP